MLAEGAHSEVGPGYLVGIREVFVKVLLLVGLHLDLERLSGCQSEAVVLANGRPVILPRAARMEEMSGCAMLRVFKVAGAADVPMIDYDQ